MAKGRYSYETAGKGWWRKLESEGKRMRREPTPAEEALWQRIRGGKLGIRFRRQHVIDRFVVDFVCLRAKLIVEIDGSEVPIMDGSSAPFVFLIDCAGIETLDVPRRRVKILKPIKVEDGEKSAELLPGDGFSMEFQIDFDCPVISQQRLEIDLDGAAFRKEICRARTFGYVSDVQQLRELGLAQGASLDNTIAIDGDDILNKEGLRYTDEFVRHKALDAIGDLYLAGMAIEGKFVGVRSGHGVNNALLRALFDQPDAWEYIEEQPQYNISVAAKSEEHPEELASI